MRFNRTTLESVALAVSAAACARMDVLVDIPRPHVKREKPGAPIDFHAVPPHQREIDGRLRNWGIWCNSTAAASSAPMFRLAVASVAAKREQNASGVNIDRNDAIRIARAVTALPEKHASALNWCYVKPVSPRRACEAIGVSMEGLAALLHEGRQMLINRLCVTT